MEIRGTWTKDEEGYMEFDSAQVQRLYEAVTDQYHLVYNQYLEDSDEDEAYYKALQEGYELVTDYKTIDGANEFATTYLTPTYMVDIWYAVDKQSQKRIYDRGFIQIKSI